MELINNNLKKGFCLVSLSPLLIFLLHIVLTLWALLGTIIIYPDSNLQTGCPKNFTYNTTYNSCIGLNTEATPLLCSSNIFFFSNVTRTVPVLITDSILCDILYGIPTLAVVALVTLLGVHFFLYIRTTYESFQKSKLKYDLENLAI
jgi:hypothetical protein